MAKGRRVTTSLVAPLALVAAYALDAVFGEPPNALHPVAWMGKLIARGRDWALRGGSVGQLVRGGAVALAVCALSALAVAAALRPFASHPAALAVASALLLKPLFAVRALRDAAFQVRDALVAGDLPHARAALAALCSRDAGALGAPAVSAAAVESLAENASDSIVAPLLFYGLFGLPGAAFYRAANTLDAMIGYHGRFERVGKVAARLDDLLNLVPARLTALLLLVAGAYGGDVRHGFTVLRRDGARTESPNAGRPMATMAGLLGVELTKDGVYRLGDPTRAVEPADITRAWAFVSRASLGALAVTTLLLVAKAAAP
jgi:adenosylcobinamide-phosphate synthase